MKTGAIVFIAIVIMSSCYPKNGETTNQHLRQENFDLKKENDSLKAMISKSERSFEGDTIQKISEPAPIKTPATLPALAGKHLVTLQWISWDRPGSVMIGPLDNGWHSIKGGQNGEQGGYLRIDGKIKPLNDRELEFEGRIEHNVHNITSGEPCTRKGKQVFKATGTRKYWRLQQMLSCDSTTTDYVDIFF